VKIALGIKLPAVMARTKTAPRFQVMIAKPVNDNISPRYCGQVTQRKPPPKGIL
jgi:hypothetical protein